MYHFRRNKSELMVLTGAIYAFVAYLTAFALEILFLVDLTRRGNEILSSLAAAGGNQDVASSAADSSSVSLATTTTSLKAAQDEQQQQPNDRFAFETLQAHVTIACLTIAILYFVVFITSLILIVALILRSTFMLLIWMCAMATLYLPEFGLVAYVALYAWGLDTRNGQTELLFYLMRATLNLIFILRARKLYKQWNYEKNFFRLGKSGTVSSGGNFHAGSSSAYDSPYFIGRAGDSLSTTINPIFSSSTLNLNRYDFVRDQFNQQQHHQRPGGNTNCNSPETQNSNVYISSSSANSEAATSSSASRRQRGAAAGADQSRVLSAFYTRELPTSQQQQFKVNANNRLSYDFNQQRAPVDGGAKTKQFYLGDLKLAPPASNDKFNQATQRQNQRLSVLSLNDDYADYELDLDYRTLGKSSPPTSGARRPRPSESPPPEPLAGLRHYQQPFISGGQMTTGQRFQPNHYDDSNRLQRHQVINTTRVPAATAAAMSRSYDDLAYSTQSLDRRNSRNFTLTEQVVLQPLGHQPFEYLHRPGSTTNLNYR